MISHDPWSVLKNSIILVPRRFLDWNLFQTWIDSNWHTLVEPVRLKIIYPYLEMRVTVTGDDITWYLGVQTNCTIQLWSFYCYYICFIFFNTEITTVHPSNLFMKRTKLRSKWILLIFSFRQPSTRTVGVCEGMVLTIVIKIE